MVRLETETKLITHAVKMAAFNAETALARALHGRYARAGDEAYALIREALAGSGDIIPGDGTLTIRLDPLTAPRRTRAIAALCDQLNTAQATFPGTSLILRYEDERPPGHCINDLLCPESWGRVTAPAPWRTAASTWTPRDKGRRRLTGVFPAGIGLRLLEAGIQPIRLSSHRV